MISDQLSVISKEERKERMVVLENVMAEWARPAAVCNLIHPNLDAVSTPDTEFYGGTALWKDPRAGTIRFEWGEGDYAEFHDAIIIRHAEVHNLVSPDYTYELRCGTGYTTSTNQRSFLGRGGGPDSLPVWLNGGSATMIVYGR